MKATRVCFESLDLAAAGGLSYLARERGESIMRLLSLERRSMLYHSKTLVGWAAELECPNGNVLHVSRLDGRAGIWTIDALFVKGSTAPRWSNGTFSIGVAVRTLQQDVAELLDLSVLLVERYGEAAARMGPDSLDRAFLERRGQGRLFVE